MILYCVPKLRLMGQKFSVREKMDISDLQVGELLPFSPLNWDVMGTQAMAPEALTVVHLATGLLL